jgi:hypothetical protein
MARALAPQAVETSEEDLRAAIAERAYHIAEQRGFEPGMELDDWLAAEALVRQDTEENSAQ